MADSSAHNSGNAAWVPLESNPEVLTKYARQLGMRGDAQFYDVYSIDLLDMVPQPVFAVILLFPITARTEQIRVESAKSTSDLDLTELSKPFFCKQTIGNACGTIAILHAIANSPRELIPLAESSFFSEFLQRAQSSTPDQRAHALETSTELCQTHAQFARQGQTETPSQDQDIDLHFVSFVHCDGTLFELDGRQLSPCIHGKTSPESLLYDACIAIRNKYMDADPTELRFTMVALAL
mmetsp:Transcript_6462/g.11526  ORF Transcript_6462/g.11526 Transcript_6462/m.11526 type:complete len:238 (-) Transcript_6462:8911-9624(-)